ncbi:DUF6502 family protein [Roseomonas elaeocarpi]|uniref:DUF6502 family protein n=1 Tax=Roseomonas elaeocarpi TaxID=907779 RepID=A0ABV6JRE3_9PROT
MAPGDRDAGEPGAQDGAALLRALRRLLRPLVRFLVRSGITFPVLADLLRVLYVEVVTEDLLSDPRSRTDSRVSLLTGVHRKEIRRLRTAGEDSEEAPPLVTVSSQIIGRWLGLPAYATPAGGPAPLPRTAAPDGGASFEALVASVTTDLRPRTVLDDWLQQGIVTIDAEDRVRLNVGAFLPRPGRSEQLFYFARNLHDHLAAAAANLTPSEGAQAGRAAPFLDRSVHYDRLSPDLAARLEAAGREGAQRLLLEINRLALTALEAEGEVPAGSDLPTRRVNLGIYLYAEDEPRKPGA